MHPHDRPYPTHGVIIVCMIITGEIILLFAILRPFCLSLRRAVNALIVFSLLFVAEFLGFSGATDGPGYAYSNHFFLLLTLGLLAATAGCLKLVESAH
jgi:hypothetical protein